MLPTRQGSFRLFRFAGIDVFLHWSWFLIAVYEIQLRSETYSSIVWNILEYLALFAIVTMHEFGHALACRSVGGTANQIVLWPLGGVAYVDPPQRPGATLWSIAAGPLVNLVLLPILVILNILSAPGGLVPASPDLHRFIHAVTLTNLVLLVFNMLPVYPLDGGQILRSLLWFIIGRARSLMVSAIIGFAGVILLAALAIWDQNIWFGVIAFFVATRCWNGFKVAQALTAIEKAPRHLEFACPSCKESPPRGPFWKCSRCRSAFDTFETMASCPQCATPFATTRCVNCGENNPISAWAPIILTPPPL